jgi:hypothetical protein
LRSPARMSATGVTFRVADPDDRFAGVRLVQDVRVPGDRREFARAGSGWELELARPSSGGMRSTRT